MSVVAAVSAMGGQCVVASLSELSNQRGADISQTYQPTDGLHLINAILKS